MLGAGPAQAAVGACHEHHIAEANLRQEPRELAPWKPMAV